MTRQEHLLTIAMEECNEVAQRLSKALRFGMDEAQPIDTGGDGKTDNRDRIWNEWCDLVALMRMLDIPCASIKAMEAKKEKVERFLAYSEQCGTLAASEGQEPPAQNVLEYLRSVDDPYESFEGNAEACRFCFARRGKPHKDCIWQQAVASSGTPGDQP